MFQGWLVGYINNTDVVKKVSVNEYSSVKQVTNNR